MKRILYTTLLIGLTSFGTQSKKITLYMIGDSTMSIKEVRAYPETGWGMPFSYFFDSSVAVDNRAKNGRSTKSFLAEGLWKPVYDNLQKDDYVIIQFGHNDESVEKQERYSPPQLFKTNLEKYIEDTRAKGATPILLTPVSRRKFDSRGNQVETHREYSGLVREVAKEQKVHFIDLDKMSRELYQKLGKEPSKLLFLQLAPGEHPNYPEGKEDNTHFTELGARLIAQLVLAEIRKLDLELNSHIVKPSGT